MKPSLLLGAGGHAKVLLDALSASGRPVLGLLDQDKQRQGNLVLGYAVLGQDDYLSGLDPQSVCLINALGSTRNTAARSALYLDFRARGFEFGAVIHPAAVISAAAGLAHAVQVMAGAVVQAAAEIGENVLLNTRCIVEHDCRIGAHSHIASGATLCGNVTVGAGCHIGAGAVVVQGIRIGEGSLIAAGAVVTRDVPAHSRMAGVPAKSLVV